MIPTDSNAQLTTSSLPRKANPTPGRLAGATQVAAAAFILLAAASIYQQFLQEAPALWYSTSHDRNGHYGRSQRFAVAFREGKLGALVKEVHASTVWPPLHPLVTGLVLAVSRLDYRLAVLSSLAAWVMTCWFAFALARRLAPSHKELAGWVALLFTLASPAHRAFAADIMIESLGAGLTLATLYFYVTALDDRSAWRGRCFALLFLALFLTKYNYWTLLAAGLLLATIYRFRSSLWTTLKARRADAAPLARSAVTWCLAQFRHPLTYLLIPALALAFYVYSVGPLSWTIAGRQVTISTLDMPAQLCYVLVLLRVLPWWWRSGRKTAAELAIPARQVISWFVYPLAIWFLWPRRLGVFLWYVTYGQHGRSGAWSPWIGNLGYYWQCLSQDYHASQVSLIFALVLIGVALLGWQRWKRGTAALFIFLAVAALLTNYHSANRSRFLHSWLAVGWVAAGIGAGRIGELFDKLLNWRRRDGLSFLRPALTAAALAVVIAAQGAALWKSGHAEEGGLNPALPSLLVIGDSVSPPLTHARQPALVCNAPLQLLLEWRLWESPGQHPRLQVPPQGTATNQLDAWLQQAACDSLLLVDWPTSYDCSPPSELNLPAVRSRLVSSGFEMAAQWHFPACRNITAQLWRPRAAVALQAGRQ